MEFNIYKTRPKSDSFTSMYQGERKTAFSLKIEEFQKSEDWEQYLKNMNLLGEKKIKKSK